MKKRVLAFMLLIVVLLTTGCSFNANRVRIGTAGIGGIYNEFGTAFTQQFSDIDNINMEVKTTSGSPANVRLLAEDYLELAIAQADVIDNAYYGKNSFENNKAYNGYSAVASLYTEACHIVVKDSSSIKNVDDLLNKTVSVGESESGTEQNAKQILQAYGISENMLSCVNLDYTQSATELVNGKIDAFFCTLGTNSTTIDELAKKCNIRLLDISDNVCKKLKSSYKFYTDYTIKKDTYNGQNSDIKTLGVNSILLASNKLSTEKVALITKTLFENSDNLEYAVSANLNLKEDLAVTGVSIPFHKGAAKYYSSKNISVKTE